MKSIRDFGAVGDGVANDTKAIQRAIDEGGVICVPPGIYRTGTLYLKSGGGLHLEANAILLASHDRKDYNADDFCVQNDVFSTEHVTGAHLIVAVEQQDISLTGEGVIDGDCHYWNREKSSHADEYLPNPERPGQMVFLCECKGIKVDGIHLRNGSYWHLFLHGCQDAQITRLRITGERHQWTNDGIDIDCCQRVMVSDCLIDTGDDAITLRGDDGALKNKRPCEQVTVSNCVLSSNCDNAIRIGVGGGVIRNCLLSNLIIHHSRTGLCLISRFSENGQACHVENLMLSNLMVEAHRPFNMKLSNLQTQKALASKGYIRNITISNLHAESDRCCNILGHPGGELSDIRLKDCDFLFGGHGKAPLHNEAGMYGYDSTDSAINIDRAEAVTLENVRIRWKDDTAGWHHDVAVTDSSKVSFRQCDFTKGYVGLGVQDE